MSYHSTGVDLGPPYSGWLTPESELDEIEFGDRVCDWLVNDMLAAAYSTEKDRIWATITNMVGAVSHGTSPGPKNAP